MRNDTISKFDVYINDTHRDTIPDKATFLINLINSSSVRGKLCPELYPKGGGKFLWDALRTIEFRPVLYVRVSLIT